MAPWSENTLALPAVIAVSLASSVLTALVTVAIVLNIYEMENSASISTHVASKQSGKSTLDCGGHVYSPVQNACVDQSVFDREMQRLFNALGVDPSIYQFREREENPQ